MNLSSLMVARGKQAELVSFEPKSRKMLWFWRKWGFVVFINLRLKANVCLVEGEKEHEFKWEWFFVMFLTALPWKRVMQGSGGLSLHQECK